MSSEGCGSPNLRFSFFRGYLATRFLMTPDSRAARATAAATAGATRRSSCAGTIRPVSSSESSTQPAMACAAASFWVKTQSPLRAGPLRACSETAGSSMSDYARLAPAVRIKASDYARLASHVRLRRQKPMLWPALRR